MDRDREEWEEEEEAEEAAQRAALEALRLEIAGLREQLRTARQ